MKKTWWIWMMLLWLNCASAQIVLEPCATGHVRVSGFCFHGWDVTFTITYSSTYTLHCYTTSFHADCSQPHVLVGRNERNVTSSWSSGGYTRNSATNWKGVIEFPLSTGNGSLQLPTSNMTPYNWTAKIDNLLIEEANPVGGYMPTKIYDLHDDNENGLITTDDYYHNNREVTSVFDNIPSTGTTLDNFDVTEALRRDLFGEGAGDLTSGFIFQASATGFSRINDQFPRLTINMGTPTPSPSPTMTPTPQISSTPTYTAEPTVTPTPQTWSGVQLVFPENLFTGGDIFKLRALCQGETDDSYADLYVILDVYGSYWFYPNWSEEVDFKSISLKENTAKCYFILDFIWPEGDFGYAQGLSFYAAITKPGTTSIIGEMDQVVFGYY